MVLALVGLLSDVSPTRALMPLPIQPFASDALGGVSTTQLGVSITANYTITDSLQGERSALPWIFSAPGFSVDPDTGPPYDVSPPPPVAPTKPLGTVWTTIDALCDGSVDYMFDDCGTHTPLTWIEASTNKGALGSDAFLLKIMPPWNWIARHKVDITHLCLGYTGGGSTTTTSVLNTVYAEIPFSGVAGERGFVAQTKLGGAPTNPPSSVCLDTPQSSTSVTVLYNNPPTAGGSGAIRGQGLYARWTILQSQGSSSLQRAGDLRKSYLNPPSILSDIGYVERIIDLQCFWMDENGCDATHGACDGSNVSAYGGPSPNPADGIISELESWNDPDLVNLSGVGLGGINLVDTDRDCLADPAYTAQLPNQPLDTDDEPDGAPLCPVLGYSVLPMVVQYDKAADWDCDGLVDGVEKAYGSDRLLPDTDGDGAPDFVEMFQFTDPTDTDTDDDGVLDKPENNPIAAAIPSLQCGNNWDDDGDGKINDGCAQVGATTEPGAWCTDAIDNDGETPSKINDGCPMVGSWKDCDTNHDGDCADAGEAALCANAADDDSPADGVVNDGCPQSGSLSEPAAACANETDDDTADADGVVNDGCPVVATTAEGGATGEAGEAANVDDNCPTVSNPDQLNSDGQGRNNGPKIANVYASNPNQDKMGDACDDDNDNDGSTDGYEGFTDTVKLVTTDPLMVDTDGDGVNDAAEARVPGGAPRNPAVEPAWSNTQQTYFRGCNINVAKNSEHSYTQWDAEYDSIENDIEMDPDGDPAVNDGCAQVGTLKETGDQCSNATDDDTTDAAETTAGRKINDGCPKVGVAVETLCADALDNDLDGECPNDKDSDNGNGTGDAAFEVIDSIEAYGYNTGLTNKDTDGDGCQDWIEINDVNGDRQVNVGDQLIVALASNALPVNGTTGDPVSDKIVDVDKSGGTGVGLPVNVGDEGQVAKNTCDLKPGLCELCGPDN